MTSQIIEDVRSRGFTLTVRVKDGEPRTIELPGAGPWEVDFDSGVVTRGRPERPEVAAPPDDEITLRLRCTITDKVVRVYATGSGATAWADKQGKLLGVAWTRDEHGAPHVVLEKTRTLLADIRKVLPNVRIDTTECHDVNVNPAAVGGVRAAGDTKRGERMAAHDVGASTSAAATRAKAATADVGERAEAPTAADESRSARKNQQGESLQWAETSENGRKGYAARWNSGTYKALHVAGKTYGLFYERTDGSGFDMIVCGSLEDVKAAAETQMEGMAAEQLVTRVCGPVKTACPSPRGRRTVTVAELLARYGTSDVRAAFEVAVKDGLSLHADLEGLQDWKDLEVEQALVLYKERGASGASAVYAVEEVSAIQPRTRSERRTARAAAQSERREAPQAPGPPASEPSEAPPETGAVSEAELMSSLADTIKKSVAGMDDDDD